MKPPWCLVFATKKKEQRTSAGGPEELCSPFTPHANPSYISHSVRRVKPGAATMLSQRSPFQLNARKIKRRKVSTMSRIGSGVLWLRRL